ncbi:hypothetical protein GCM10020220_080100 [Nonomuraea rubra]
MTMAMLALRTADFASATLWVLEGECPARFGFYERLGWQPDGGVKDDVIGGIVGGARFELA